MDEGRQPPAGGQLTHKVILKEVFGLLSRCRRHNNRTVRFFSKRELQSMGLPLKEGKGSWRERKEAEAKKDAKAKKGKTVKALRTMASMSSLSNSMFER